MHPGLDILVGSMVDDGVSYAYGALTSNYTPASEVGMRCYVANNVTTLAR